MKVTGKNIKLPIIITITLLTIAVLVPTALAYTSTPVCTESHEQVFPAIYGNTIVWQDNRNGNWDIYMYTISTGQITPVCTESHDQGSPAVYGNRIVWQDNRNGNWDIYMYDITTGQITPVCTESHDQQYPAIYGNTIVWQDNRNGNYDFYVYDISTGHETLIGTQSGVQMKPAIYGNWIVWADYRNGNWNIYVYDISTGHINPLNTFESNKTQPAIYGNIIAWSDDRNYHGYQPTQAPNLYGNNDIYMYDISTEIETPVCTNWGNQWSPAIFGNTIIWADNRENDGAIYMYNISTGQETLINYTTHFNGNHMPYYSFPPGIYGKTIVWMDIRPDDITSDIYMADISYTIPPVTDTIPPVTTHTLDPSTPDGNNGWYKSNVKITLTATDDRSGVAKTEYSLDGGAWQQYNQSQKPLIGPGKHKLSYRSIDIAGNIETVKTIDVNVETPAPTTTCSLSPSSQSGSNYWYNGWYKSIVTVTLTAADSNGIAKTEYSLDGGAWQVYSPGKKPTIGPGKHKLSYRSTNNADNVEAAKTIDVNVDAQAPTTTCSLSPSKPDGNNGWYRSNVTLAFWATDQSACSGIAMTEYSLDGKAWQIYSLVQRPIIGPGKHKLSYRSTDYAGNVEAAKTIDINIETPAPTTTCSLSPSKPDGNNGWYKSTVTITLTATGGSVKTEYSLDGGSWKTYSSGQRLTIGPGKHKFAYRSTNSAGSVETAKTIDVNVDRQAPTTTCSVSPSKADGKNGWYRSKVTLSFATTDTSGGSGVAKTEYSLNGGTTWQTYSGSSKPVIGDGQYTLKFRSTDAAGNTESAKSGPSFKVDSTPPTIDVTGVSDNAEYILKQPLTVRWSASDTRSGIASSSGTMKTGSKLPTTTIGSKKFQVTATDKAGNTITKTINYLIKYTYTPYSPKGNIKSPKSQPLAVSFKLTDYNGNAVSNAAAYLEYKKTTATAWTAAKPTSGSGNKIKYMTALKSYLFTMKTTDLAKGNYQIRIRLDDTKTYNYDLTIT